MCGEVKDVVCKSFLGIAFGRSGMVQNRSDSAWMRALRWSFARNCGTDSEGERSVSQAAS